MRKIALVFLSVTFLSVTAQDNGFYYGTRISLGESTLKGDYFQEPDGKLFWQIGAASVFQFNPYTAITADFLLTGKGTKGSGTDQVTDVFGTRDYDYTENISLLYGEVPINLKVSIPLGQLYIKAFGGPSVNFAFGGFHTKEFEDASYNDNNGFSNTSVKTLETIEPAILYGVGIDVLSGDGRLFFLDLRINQSLSDIGTIEDKNFRSSYFALSAGYLFH